MKRSNFGRSDRRRAKAAFRTRDLSSAGALRQLLPELTPGVTRHAVRRLVGRPDEVVRFYDVFFSVALELRFASDGDLLPARLIGAEAGAGTPLTGRALRDAAHRFRRDPDSRDETAADIAASLKPGTRTTRVQTLLGPADELSWIYRINGEVALIVRFDGSGLLESVETTVD